jgi:hypothetical protein
MERCDVRGMATVDMCKWTVGRSRHYLCHMIARINYGVLEPVLVDINVVW